MNEDNAIRLVVGIMTLAGVVFGGHMGYTIGGRHEADRLSNKHCQHIVDRFQYEKCKTDFLGEK